MKAKRAAPAEPTRAGQRAELSNLPGRIHVVEPGDTLWGLTVQYYGHPKHVHRILAANRNRLSDPNKLPVGMKLIIP